MSLLQSYLTPQAWQDLQIDRLKTKARGGPRLDRPTLLDWQRQVVKESRRFNVVCVGRRAGKTALGIDLCADAAVTKYPVGWFSPSYKLMLEVWREAVRLFMPIIDRQNATERRIEFTTGGVLEFWSLDNLQAGRRLGNTLGILAVPGWLLVARMGLLDVWLLMFAWYPLLFGIQLLTAALERRGILPPVDADTLAARDALPLIDGTAAVGLSPQ